MQRLAKAKKIKSNNTFRRLKKITEKSMPLKQMNKELRFLEKEDIIKRAGGRKNSKVTPELTRKKYVLPRIKSYKQQKVMLRRGEVMNSGLGSNALSDRELDLVLENGWDNVTQRFRPGTSKASKAKVKKILKSKGVF
jgi:hypothetical protein